MNGQSENVTVIVANDGIETAKNVIVILKVVDAQRSDTLVIHEEKIGDLGRGERKWISIRTPVHSGASSVYVEARIEWGEYREFYNPDIYIRKTYSVYT
ncbi:hypothetical protein CUJ83_06565 [Methanocella sp. CWC-04]|uniref:CARDB domain-containing protein n=1 Tax=Methanooceanicella nereidis TaxID=2052831 RepID=A0AAP2RBS8_9EURY|nr:hypothetical protein [Methanocella sp. CWC-04]